MKPKKTAKNSFSIKGSVKDFLQGNLNRRSFLTRLTALGFTATAAQKFSKGLSLPKIPASTSGPARSVQGNGGTILIEQLKQCGVEFIFGNPSAHNGPIYDALIDRKDMNLILGLNENTLTAIADGYGKASGKVPFVTVSRPGFPNTMTHMYNGFKDQTPLIVCADQIDEASRGRHGNQETDDLIEAAEPFTQWTWESRRPENLAEDLRRAFKFSSTFPQGPVFLSVPRDFLETKTKADIIDMKYFTHSNEVRADQGLVEEVADLLIQSESPLLYVGDEINTLGAEKEAVELADLLSIPVVQPPENCRWSNSFPTDHTLYLGDFKKVMRHPKSVDMLLNLGGRLRPHEGPTPLISPKTKIVQVRLNTESMGRVYPSLLSHPSNVKLFTQDLIEAVKSRASKSDIQKWRETRRAEAEVFKNRSQKSFDRVVQQRWEQNPISVERLGMELKDQLDPDAYLVQEMDSGEVIIDRILSFGQNKMQQISTAGVALGWSLGASVGAKIALPNRQVVAMLGDGAFMFGGSQAMWNMKRYQVPVLTIVLNNHSYDGERSRVWGRGTLQGKQGKDMTCYLGDPDIDFTHLAKAYGVPGAKVNNPNELKSALKRGIEATRSGEPYLLDIEIARRGTGAESTWYPSYSVADQSRS